MKLIRLVSSLLCLSLLVALGPIRTEAFERSDHDAYMTQVLFKNYKDIAPKKNGTEEETALYAIACASYLCIDQFNGHGKNELQFLRDYQVQNLPESISDIDYTASGSTHRNSTHRGWDFKYVGDAADRWKNRKSILLNTADAVFDFKEDPAKKNAFCALIYYIHVLGDHMDDESYKTKNGLKIDIGGRTDHYDIISELKTSIKVLFRDQQGTEKYTSLIVALDRYDANLSELVSSEGGINTDEKFMQKREYTENVMELLTLYIPEMLKAEDFFANVFYK